ncbi:zinc finger matrin-type protein 2-like [Sycon ciliatum]|uniref:zinc finger matrin-type protein 2-like n=1 Tax=Sycon ciliatum TaxID=27933 RepID=UPI0020A84895|eukprot:scpid94416/ scgid6534/ Zinc finger matrin-type protein 2 &gt; Zinc finger matrin-type protein 2
MAKSADPNSFRRTWDKEEFAKRAQDRADDLDDDDLEPPKKKPPVKRELLKRRDYEVDLDSKLNKSIVITKATPLSQTGGYYCNVCDCTVRDSINFLDHINGKKHQRNLGMSMRVERSTVDQVKKRFEFNKRKKDEQKQKYDLQERLHEVQEEAERVRQARIDRRKEKKRKAEEEEEEELDPEIAKMMGFGSFGAKKKN